MTRYEEICVYCDTEFVVEFENEDDEMHFCPSCGEEIPEFDDDVDLNIEEWDED